MTKRMMVFAALVLALAAGCSSGDDGADAIDSGVGSTDSSVDGSDGSTTETTDPTSDSSTSSSADGSDTTTSGTGTSGTGTTELPGEPWDGFAKPGDVFSVFGVAHDDVLNVRSTPGTDGDIVATADPTADDLVATGEARQLPRSFWYEMTVDGATGWVSVSFVAYEGGTDDATAEFLDGGDRPTAETMEDLGLLVADGFASTDPESDIVQSVAPTVGDLGEVTYDVVGIGDDAGAGYRLHVFGEPLESGEGFSLRSIERTSYCTRGVTGELCN